jgi:hypothetical protein
MVATPPSWLSSVRTNMTVEGFERLAEVAGFATEVGAELFLPRGPGAAFAGS